MIVSLGFDHRGYMLKRDIIKCLEENNMEYIDRGAFSEDSVDYPDYAAAVSDDIISGRADFGILACNTGIGMSIAANKYRGIRAAYVIDKMTAESARRHNNANILVLGYVTVNKKHICDIITIFLNTGFDGGRHKRRIDKICSTEQ